MFNGCNFSRLHIFLKSALLLKIHIYRHIEFVCQTDEFRLLLLEQRTIKKKKKKHSRRNFRLMYVKGTKPNDRHKQVSSNDMRVFNMSAAYLDGYY